MSISPKGSPRGLTDISWIVYVTIHTKIDNKLTIFEQK